MRRRPDLVPAAFMVAGLVMLPAGLVITAAGDVPAWADPAPGPASSSPVTTTLPANARSATTGEPVSSTATTTTEPVKASTTTTTEPNTNSTTTTTQRATSTTSTQPARPTTTMTPRVTMASLPAAGTLSISAPGLTDLGADPTDARIVSGRLGTVTVSDKRGLVDGAWTASVSATTFSAGQRSAHQRLPRSRIAYWSGPVLSRTGIGTLEPDHHHPGPPTAVAGRYHGTIVHSVA